MISESCSNIGHQGSKLGHTSQVLKNLIYTLVVTFFVQLSSNLVRLIVLFIVGMSLNMGHLKWKARFQELKKNLDNNLVAAVLIQISWKSIQKPVLIITRLTYCWYIEIIWPTFLLFETWNLDQGRNFWCRVKFWYYLTLFWYFWYNLTFFLGFLHTYLKFGPGV
jgi:hypothetical protein